MKRVFSRLIVSFAFLPLSVAAYAAWWAVHYRMPPSPDCFVDLRHDASQPAFYVTFCASLATNPHGFPGHSYVVWSRTPNWHHENAEAFGFVPRYSRDQVASAFMNVPGLMVHGASEGNMVNLDTLNVIVDKEKYEETRKLRDEWNPSSFRAGLYDCVSFTDFIAEATGLEVPIRRFSYPQDHLKQMMALNQSVSASGLKEQSKVQLNEQCSKQAESEKLCRVNNAAVQF